MFNPRTENAFTPDDYWKIATVMLAFGFVGILLNLFVIFNLIRRPVFHCAFGRICLTHSIAACGNNATFALMVAPITFINVELHESFLGKRSGLLICLFWTAGILSHLLMAVNRFVCMYFPFRYAGIFTDNFTRICLGVIWTLSIAVSLAQFIPGCECFIWIDNFNFEFYPNFCGILLGLYADFVMSVISISLVAVLDFLTYLKIRRHFSVNRVTNLGNTGSACKNNVRFFYQSAAQGFASGIEIISYFYISPLLTDKWLRYGFSACLFFGINAADPIIVAMFNKEIRHQIYISKKDRYEMEQAQRVPTQTTSTMPGFDEVDYM